MATEMTMRANGDFDVNGAPQKMDETGLNAMRMVFHKTFHGALTGSSVARR